MASAAQTNQNAISNTPQAKDDVATAFEAGELISIAALMANDAGGNGKSFYGIYGATTTSWGATLTVENGSIRYDGSGSARLQSLAQGQTITDTFQYAIQLGKGVISIATVKMTITGTNDGPVAVADTATTSENQVVIIDALANDIDIDNGAVKSLVSVTSPKGTASIEGGKVRFDPGTAFDHLGQGATELVTLTYAMRDEHGFVSESTIRITVTGVNDGPVAIADVAAGSENQTLVIDVLSNDTDVDDGATQTLVSVSAPKGSATVVGNKVTFDPGSDFDQLALGQTEVVTLTYTMRDEHGAEASATVTVTVTGTNDAPVAVADTAATDENGAIVVDVLANDTDVDAGATQTLTAVSAPKGAATIVANKLAFDPGADFDHLAVGQSETIVVAYTMADEHGATASSTLTITITGTNDAPVAVADTAATTENATIVIDALANDTDVDSGAVLTLTSVSAPKGSATIVDGKLAFDPGTAFDHLAKGATETVTLTYAIADERGATSTSTVTVTVTGTNDAPVVTSGAAAAGSVVEAGNLDNGTVVAGTPSAAGTLTASDVDNGATRSWSGSANGSYGSFAIDAAGAWTYTLDQARADVLNEGQSVVETFTATVTDEHGATATQVVTIAVTGTNDAPTAAPVTGAATEDGGPVTIALAGADKDGEDDVSTLTYSIVNGPSAGTATIDGSSLKFDPGSGFQSLGAGQTQQVTVGYIATDARGATSGGTQAGPVTTLANFDMADLTSTRSLTADAVASGVTVSALTANGALAGTPFSNHFYLSGWGTTIDTSKYYEVTINPNGKAIDFDTVRFAMENAGANNATWYLRSSVDNFSANIATGTLTNQDVTNFTADLNGLPVAAGPVTFRWYMTSPVNVTTGFANHESPGSGGGLPDVGQDLVFTGRIIETAAQTATITVTGVNDAPVAVADTATVNENGVVLVSPLTNDTDVDAGDTKTLVSVSANKGSATVVGNQIRYDSGTAFDSLNVGQFENVELTYTMRDAAGATSTSTVTVRVNGANDAPVAVADSATTQARQAVSINALANDTDVDAGDSKTLVSATAPKGTASVVGGQVRFDPGNAFDALQVGQSEDVTVAYTMRDAAGATSSSTITVKVNGTNVAPVAADTMLVANRLGNGGFDATPNFDGWTTSTALSGTNIDYGSTVSVDRSGTLFPNDQAVAVLDFAAGVPAPFGTGQGPSIVSDAFEAQAGETVRFTYRLSSGGDHAVGYAYIRDADTGAIIQTVFEFNTGFTGSTGVQTKDVVLTQSGNYTLEFRVGSYDATGGQYIGAKMEIGFAGVIREGIGEGTPFTFSNVKAQFLGTATDANGDPLSIQSVAATSAKGGLVTYDAATGALTYDPNGKFEALAQGQSTTDTITYTVADGRGGTDTATATITVTGENDAPTLNASAASRTLVEAGGTSPGVASALVQLSKADVDGTASYDLTGWTQIGTGIYSKAATYGTVVLNTTTDALVYNLDNNDPDTQGLAAGQTVTDSVSVSVTDGALSATKTAVFTINGAAEVVVNGFETGLDGWQTIGSAARTMGGAFDGDYKLTLDGGGATDAEMEAFLGIASGTLDGIADGDATVGSAALKTITLGAGETFSMHWFFGASDPDGAAFNDFGFVRAPDGSVVELASQVENGNAWFEYSYTATTAGAYTFGFGTVNVNDESYNSPLHLDGDLPLI